VSPCGVCDSCVAIANATSLDVIEMDAASNNSVDDIRDLRERVAYAPVSGRHKVYILDEAHMLSTQAWNAFLKTLEEPPPNTIFVLATTEAQKVLPTVVDRCHRFDFQRPSVPEIAGVLRRVADAEKIEIGDEAIALIARSATGSFRDALGTLEQLTTYSGEQIGLDDVLAVLGVADAELLFQAVDAVAAHDERRVLEAVARLGESGRDVGQFYRDLEAHLRALLVVQTLGEVPEPLRLTPEHDARLAEQAERVSGRDLVSALDNLAGALAVVKEGADARIQLEVALLKVAAPRVDASTRALLARVEQLEARLGAAAAPVVPPGEDAPSTAPRAARASEPPVAVAATVPVPERARSGGGETVAVAAAVVTEVEGPALELDGVRAVWPAVLEAVQAENAMLAALLGDARVVTCADDTITIAFARSAAFLKKKAEDRHNRELLASAVRTVTGRAAGLAFELSDVEAAPDDGGVPLTEEELVARLVAEFGAEEILDEPDEG
jgi:DNA polymerase III subunit gamma/tau